MTLDVLLAAGGGLYLVISALLFVFGSNLILLSAVVWRRGGWARPTTVALGVDAPRVTVQLPIYNELYVAPRIIGAACRLDYPADRLQIQVLDDSTDETAVLVRQTVATWRADGVDIELIQRNDRSGYKAGALQKGMETATGEFVAVFDADFDPPANFLTEKVPHFADPNLAFVQARWGHVNRDYSWITRLQSLAIDGHFMVEQAARGHRGYWFNFNGTAGIWRTAAIADAGGWTHDTLTEDLDLSYRAHLAGWRGHYRGDLEVPGEVPAQMSSFRRQQHRWARGSLECARKLLPSVWRSDASAATRFQATMHLSAYTIHLLLLALAVIYPIVVLAADRFSGLSTLFGLGYFFALSAVAPAVFFSAGQRHLRPRWWLELPRMLAVTVIGSGLMINTSRAAVQIFTRPNPEFERTAKFGIIEAEPVGRSWTQKRYQLDLDRIVYAEALLGLYCFATAWLAFTKGNWGIMIYAVVFGSGLLSVVVITVGQAIAVYRSRSARAGRVKQENADLQATPEAIGA